MACLGKVVLTCNRHCCDRCHRITSNEVMLAEVGISQFQFGFHTLPRFDTVTTRQRKSLVWGGKRTASVKEHIVEKVPDVELFLLLSNIAVGEEEDRIADYMINSRQFPQLSPVTDSASFIFLFQNRLHFFIPSARPLFFAIVQNPENMSEGFCN